MNNFDAMDLSIFSPLCVDLDGTLIKSDVLYIAWKQLVQNNILKAFFVLCAVLKGRAYFKQQLANASPILPEMLNYNMPFLAFLKQYKKQKAGILVLATATDIGFAKPIADYLGIFDSVIASEGEKNLRAHAKADILSQTFGYKQYTYAGNSYDDIAVWDCSKHAIAVNLSLRAQYALKGSHLMFDLYFE